MTKRTGDSGEPWGSPESNWSRSSILPSKWKLSVLSVKKFLVHATPYPWKPIAPRTPVRLLCLTVLTAPSLSLTRIVGRSGGRDVVVVGMFSQSWAGVRRRMRAS